MIDEKKLIEDIHGRTYIPAGMAEIFETIIDEQTKIDKCADCSRRQFYQQGYEAGKREAQQWIPCSERMPEKEGRYITTSYSTYKRDIGLECFDLWYEDGQWYVDSDDYLYEGEVIAWMPLPEPYREEGDSDEKN